MRESTTRMARKNASVLEIDIHDLTLELTGYVERMHAVVTAMDTIACTAPFNAQGIRLVRGLIGTLVNEATNAMRVSEELKDARKEGRRG